MTRLTDDQTRALLSKTFGKILQDSEWDTSRLASEIVGFFDGYDLPSALYEPDRALKDLIHDYQAWKAGKKNDVEAADLMERIAILAFRCLKGHNEIKSYTSYSHQHDLLISGSGPDWSIIMQFLLQSTSSGARSILIEAKNIKGRVGDPQFSRLCSILENKFDVTCQLGVFLTRKGASGFPIKSSSERQRSLRDSRATQVIFHAKTRKFVVVLDDNDIESLTEKGALIRILEKKIRDVEEVTGLRTFEDKVEDFEEIDLPPRLLKYITALPAK